MNNEKVDMNKKDIGNKVVTLSDIKKKTGDVSIKRKSTNQIFLKLKSLGIDVELCRRISTDQ